MDTDGDGVDAGGFAAVLLYDGVCGLCHRCVRFILRRDRAERFGFAALDSAYARAMLTRGGLDAASIDSLALVELPPAGSPASTLAVSTGAAAVLRVLRILGSGWALLAAVLGLLPRPALEYLYRAVALRRYRVFGRFDACPAPPPKWRKRFIA